MVTGNSTPVPGNQCNRMQRGKKGRAGAETMFVHDSISRASMQISLREQGERIEKGREGEVRGRGGA